MAAGRSVTWTNTGLFYLLHRAQSTPPCAPQVGICQRQTILQSRANKFLCPPLLESPSEFSGKWGEDMSTEHASCLLPGDALDRFQTGSQKDQH